MALTSSEIHFNPSVVIWQTHPGGGLIRLPVRKNSATCELFGTEGLTATGRYGKFEITSCRKEYPL